jgi:hypothetical protein
VDVDLHDGARVVGHARLSPGANDSLEGAITVPEDAGHALALVGRARVLGEVVATVARPLAVADDATPATAIDREASPLSHFSLQPLVRATVAQPGGSFVGAPGEAPAPAPPPDPVPLTLDAWVVGGVCVPEVRCELMVDTGNADVDAALRDCAGVDPGEASREGRYQRLALVVRGPEGTCSLAGLAHDEAHTELGRRALRLPVALATPVLTLESPLADDGVPHAAVVAPPGREGAVLDVFRAGRWMRTVTVAASADPASVSRVAPIEMPPLPQGVYLLEARTDALPTTYVSPRLLVVGGDAALEAEADRPAHPGQRGLELAFYLAAHEQDGLALPTPASGLSVDRARLEARRRTTRTIAFVGMAVGILLLVVAVMRRGLSADAQARALLAAAGVEGADDAAARRRGRLTVALMVLALALACAAGASMLAARQMVVDSPAVDTSLPEPPPTIRQAD